MGCWDGASIPRASPAWRSPNHLEPQAHSEALLRWLQGSVTVTATLCPGRQTSTPCAKHPTGINSAPELTRSVPGSVPLLLGDGGPCPGRRWMHFGALWPTWDPRPQPASHLQEQASYWTSSSTQPLPLPSRAGNATDARDILPMAGLVTDSPRAQLQPLAHTDIPDNSSTHPSLPWLFLCSLSPGHMLHMRDPLLNA